MNRITNYLGNTIYAVGAPFSVARAESMGQTIGLTLDMIAKYLKHRCKHECFDDERYVTSLCCRYMTDLFETGRAELVGFMIGGEKSEYFTVDAVQRFNDRPL